ncbi:putative src kinase-associated phosphoprotein 2-A [Apostichopus japonicus]|uniref:Putative src kinase-associated phosphoprotein 2-A n=1 Tax=Stichopus japonicus TaxID=307972 RepID=A0A2G8KY24_STIJA|nr:putative src kinase-associated phosphoprotein 2-A [Apostichopus japonicus]
MEQQVLEDVKKLLKDIDHFFTVTLKKEKLKKDAASEKDRLYSQVKETLSKLVGEEPQEEYDDASSYMHERPEEEDSGMLYDETSVELPPKPLPSLDNLSHTGSQKSSENDEDNDEDKGDVNYEGAKMRPKSVSELTQSIKEGFLDKKRKEGQFGFSAWQTRYCIIKDNIMYYFKSKTDSKQCNEIDLSGYEAVSAPDMEKKHKRRQFLIVVSQPGFRSFQFIAQSDEEMNSWIEAVNIASKLSPKLPEPALTSGGDGTSVGGEEDDFGDEYEDLDEYQLTKLGQGKKPDNAPTTQTIVEEADDFDDEYEDLSEYQKFKATQAKPAAPALPPKEVPSFDPDQGGDDFGDEYEDLDDYQKFKMAGGKKEPEVTSSDFGETYDDVSIVPPPPDNHISVRDTPLPPPPIEVLKRDLPQPPSKELPPTPPEETNGSTANEPWDKDFKNIYMSKWDCRPDEENELELKRGDLIHILSQDYGGWWIGEKDYRVGLVPKDFLMKAYVLA